MMIHTLRHSVSPWITRQRIKALTIGLACLCIIVATLLLKSIYPEYRFGNDTGFLGFWETEHYTQPSAQQVIDFRLSRSTSSVQFQPQWSDYYVQLCGGAQITTLRVFAPLNQIAAITIDHATTQVDYQPRRIQLLQCQQTHVALTSSSPFVPTVAEPRPVTFGIYAASRTIIPTLFMEVMQIIIALVLSGLLYGLIWVNLRIIKWQMPPWGICVLTLISLCIWMQFTVVNGELLYILIGILLTLYLFKSYIAPTQLRWVFVGLLIGIPLMRLGLQWWYIGSDGNTAVYPMNLKQAIPLTAQPYWLWFCVVVSAQIVLWIRSPQALVDGVWWALLIGSVTVLQTITGYWGATGWSNTLDLTLLTQWSAVGNLLAHMRIAVPPLLLIIEYIIRDYPLFQTLYSWSLPSIALSVCLMLSISAGVLAQRQRIARAIISIILLCTIVIIKGTLNFFIYDVLTGFFLVVYCQLLRRQQFTPTRAFAMGLVLMSFDMMRPFTMIFVPLLAVLGGYHIYKTQGWQRVLYFCAPLIVLVIWHSNHILALGQWNWTNHAGFNICHAWSCPPVPLLPEAPPLSSGLWPNINTAIHQANSQQLLQAFMVNIQTHPEIIMPTLWRLLQNNLFITRTLEVRSPAIITLVFTFIYISGILLHLYVAGNAIRTLRQQTWRQWIDWPGNIFFWYSVIILCMIVITTITESGENYRWIIGFTFVLGYLPDDIFTNTRVIMPQPVILVAKEA